jgi:hypothetical protein
VSKVRHHQKKKKTTPHSVKIKGVTVVAAAASAFAVADFHLNYRQFNR